MSDNSINSPTFTELELSGIAIVLYLLISPIHGISKITEPILKMFNIKSATSLLFFTGFLFGVIYYFSIELVLHPMYKKLRAVGFKVGGQEDTTNKGFSKMITGCEELGRASLHRAPLSEEISELTTLCKNLSQNLSDEVVNWASDAEATKVEEGQDEQELEAEVGRMFGNTKKISSLNVSVEGDR